MTVDSLHASFQKIDAKVRHMIEKGCTNSSLEQCIRRLWSQQFHHSLSKPALHGMIMHYRAMYSSRKTRKAQKGGMAPLEYSGGQGATESVYGRFPVEGGSSRQYVGDLGLNRTFESSIGTTCTSQQGSSRRNRRQKQKGGGILDTAMSLITDNGISQGVGMGHPIASIPQNPTQAIYAFQGKPTFQRSPPEDPAWKLRHFNPKIFNAQEQQTFQLSPTYSNY
jgi:hypothetical protein